MLRFKDNNDLYPEYVERSLDECFFIRNEKQVPTADYPLMAFTAEGGVCEKGERYDRSALVKNANKLYKRTELNDFIYSSNNLDVGSIGLNKYGSAVISDVYEIFRINTDVVIPEYISECMQFPQNLNKMLRYRQGALYGQYRIHPENFLKIKIKVPCYQEQAKIVDFLLSVDSIIADYEAQIIKTQNQKKGVIQKLFSQEVRFKADDGSYYPDWEYKRIGELYSPIKGAPLSKADISDEGTPFILYGELYTTYNEVATDIVRKTNKKVDDKYYSKGDDVVIPTSGETPEDISTSTCVVPKGVILAGDLNIYRNSTINGKFFSYVVNHAIKYDIARIAQGASVIHIKADDVAKLYMPLPCIEEQDKIVACLTSFNEVIEDLQNIVERWKALKKGLLQQLFA